MTTQTQTAPLSAAAVAPIVAAALAGLMLIYFAGLSQAETIHNAAHDTRHSIAFPCH